MFRLILKKLLLHSPLSSKKCSFEKKVFYVCENFKQHFKTFEENNDLHLVLIARNNVYWPYMDICTNFKQHFQAIQEKQPTLWF